MPVGGGFWGTDKKRLYLGQVKEAVVGVLDRSVRGRKGSLNAHGEVLKSA